MTNIIPHTDIDISKSNILIVDDIKSNIDTLSITLRDNYIIHSVTNGADALKFVQKNPSIDLILLDIMMPGINGHTVCKILKADKNTKDIPIIFITALNENEDKTLGFNLGAVDYITKPFSIEELKARIQTHLHLQKAKEVLKNQKEILEQKVKERTKKLEDTTLEIVHRLGRAAEYRDNDTGMHIKRVSHYCEKLGKTAGLSKEKCEILLHASPMHDVGKIGIPDSILLKPGALIKEEWEIMKTHTIIGGKILSKHDSPLLSEAETIALTHHENWDGSGYPKQLKGMEIPVKGRIVGLCDFFDALTSIRPYKKAWEIKDAMEEIKKNSGIKFDPNLVKAFEIALKDIIVIKNKFPDAENEWKNGVFI